MNWLDILLLLLCSLDSSGGFMRGLIIRGYRHRGDNSRYMGARLWATKFSAWCSCSRMAPKPSALVAYALLFLAIAYRIEYIGRLLSKLLRLFS